MAGPPYQDTAPVTGHAETAVVQGAPSIAPSCTSTPGVVVPPAPVAQCADPKAAPAADIPVAGAAPGWTPFKEFHFPGEETNLPESDKTTVADIVTYLKDHASLLVAIDGHLDPKHLGMGHRRINAIRSQLLKAGIAAERVRTGAFGHPGSARAGRVAVLTREP